ncbi:reverse transcriptase [Gossypium australe]|uniref:Reverse transcriptase n=1 Tax=Gossypium australe TaxID=47621 RepID=A0A5B6XB64_9ROSI|nr:reverse transcriptase [Gossypium australe]
MVFLIETKLDRKRIEKVRRGCGFNCGIDIEVEGTRGGLYLAWKSDIVVTLRSFSKWHIDVLVRERSPQKEWRFTGFYCSLYLQDRSFAWNLLRRLSQDCSYPWLVLEAFVLKHDGLWRNLLKIRLKEWAGSIRSGKEGLKKKLTKELEFLLGQDRDDETLSKIIDTRIHLNMEIDREEVYWEQRARANWLQLGDRNIAYFHKCASSRKRTNSVTKLMSEDGRKITDGPKILETTMKYFEDLFASKGTRDSRKALEGIKRVISNEDNVTLLSHFREEEVWAALKSMGPTKALGSDGFPALFFQRYWHIVGKEVLMFCLGILNRNKDFDLVNVTEIVLIPKIPNPSTLVNFRLISLCSVLYKIVAKTIANRLQNVIGSCIDEGRMRFCEEDDDQDEICTGMGGFGNEMSAKQAGLVKGAKVSRRESEIFHLLFADDCMKFREDTKQGARNMKEILKEYENCSGQCVNFNKSTIFYSSNTSAVAKELVTDLLGVRNSSNPEKYLGLPNAIPTFAMSCFLLTKTLCGMIENKIARFWWQKGAGKRGIHWCKWSHLCRPKEEGGLGFRSMAQFNIALLAKQGWRFLTSPDSLVARVFKAKYFPDCCFRYSSLGSSSSYVWRSIWAAKASLENGLIWKVGNLHLVKVADLINSNQREWNRSLIGNTFPAAEAELILQIPLAKESHEDLLVWRGELSGEFSVRSSYKLLQNSDPTAYALQDIYNGFYNKLWKVNIPLKIKLFIWKISLNYLATRTNLSLRKLTSNSLCPRCGAGEEMTNHLFRYCPVSVMIWSDLSEDISVAFPFTDFVEWLTKTISSKEIVRFIHGYIKELDATKTVNQSTFTDAVKWKSPSGQKVKINFDGAFDARSKLSASGVVVRDRFGFVLLASIELHKGVVSAFVAEAIACRRAAEVALVINRKEVIIEVDTLSIIKKCNTKGFDKSQVGSYIHDIHELRSKATNIRFEFVHRSGNHLAHILATETLRRGERIYLENGVPSYAVTQSEIEYAREPD